MSEPVTYALWLEPSGDIAYKLQERIKKLSNKYEAPVFAPHVTLLSGLKASENSLVPLVNTLASSHEPFQLQLTRAGYRDQFYESLFVHVKDSGSLKELRNTARQLFDLPEAEDYRPHLSLMYSDLSRNEKERILNIMGRDFHVNFPVKAITLMEIKGGPEKWSKSHVSVFKEH